jgi:hypothetical protein
MTMGYKYKYRCENVALITPLPKTGLNGGADQAGRIDPIVSRYPVHSQGLTHLRSTEYSEGSAQILHSKTTV